ncbi:MAG: hypothetical protein FWH36_04220 [Lentimicrobiaceae bacterium]|nr:hypothetical protein [Lentimicrobiaceae bacterium]
MNKIKDNEYADNANATASTKKRLSEMAVGHLTVASWASHDCELGISRLRVGHLTTASWASHDCELGIRKIRIN